MRKRKCSDQEIRDALSSSNTMTEAARSLNVHLSSFKVHVRRLGLYQPNPGRRGIVRGPIADRRIPLSEILSGKHPQYSTTLLKKRLIESGTKHSHRCECCNKEDVSLSYVLDHIDGNHANHSLENLQMLCPDCNSKTLTFAGRNKKRKKTLTSDTKMIDLLLQEMTTTKLLLKLNMVANGANFRRVEKLRNIVEYIKQKLPA